ncbi:MAG: LacI family DNA-binding transcriptional regulator [Ardenticatenia bacterium]|nr:LacI family DNA-binding transcriptional regulator [Ardenticatenia bacterium]
MAGTSIATASRVFSGSSGVAEETRGRVLSAGKVLNYYPNLQARSLRKKTSYSIGLIIPNLLNAYYTALADAISQMLAERGYHLLLAATRDDPASERDTLLDMVGQSVDGLIWVPATPDEGLLDLLHSQHAHAVSIVRRVPGDVIDTVVFEDFAGSKAATQHLIDIGHRRIGFIAGDVKHSSNRGRWRGYLAAMEDAALAVDRGLVKLGIDRSTMASLATEDMLRLSVPPTAVFVGSNASMPGVIRTLRLREVRVPAEMSLICFDDVDWFSFSVPPITAVSVSHSRLAEAALDLLFARIENPDAAERQPTMIEIECDLVLRGSTAPLSEPVAPIEGSVGELPSQMGDQVLSKAR